MVKYLMNIVWLTFFLLLSCSKKNEPTPEIVPANLSVTATVSTDSSGNVVFAASATNANSYEYDFGNGIFQIVANGNVTYKYPASGTYTVNVIAKNSNGKQISKSIQVIVTVSLSLIWSEEFNTAGNPDAAKWGYDIGTGSGGWGNNELQYYTNRTENASVSNGTLKITAVKENFNGSAYTSARLLTKDKFSFKYGKIEISAKLPTGGGTWPALWMLGSNINTAIWPACGEIDIMEHKGNEQNKIFGTVHHPAKYGANSDGGSVVIANATTSFHKYAVEWTAQSIKFMVDDVTFHSVANSNTLPFNQPFFILLNVAMGGNFGGIIAPTFSSGTMEVDYVRVYQ